LRRPWLTAAACEVMTRFPGWTGRVVDRLNAPPSFVETS
jgi:hypothetical protein